MVKKIKVTWTYPHSGCGGERTYLLVGSELSNRPSLVLFSEDGRAFRPPVKGMRNYHTLLWRHREGGVFWNKGARHKVEPLEGPSEAEIEKAREVIEDLLRKTYREVVLEAGARIFGYVKLA